VEVTESRVRRHRMGYIRLAAPVAHVWYSKASLAISPPDMLRDVEQIVYFNAYVVPRPAMQRHSITSNRSVKISGWKLKTSFTQKSQRLGS